MTKDHAQFRKPIVTTMFIAMVLVALGGVFCKAEGEITMAKRHSTLNSFMMSPYAAFTEPIVNAYLYNPSVDEITLKYPYKAEVETEKIEPVLICTGNGLQDGRFSLIYRIEGEGKILYGGKTEVEIAHGWFEVGIELKDKFPEAKGVSWELSAEGTSPIKGYAPLSWSHFHGQVKYLDGKWRSTYMDLRPVTWGSPGNFTVPVSEDGHFDALVPARVYAVMNVNGTGYSYDSMERWAWDYDLTEDREDVFTIGRTELYGMRAFDINGGPPTIFIIFRPTALSRILQFDTDGDGLVRDEERERQHAAMRDSPTVIGPELQAEDVRVWLNGKEEKIVQFNKIPERGTDLWQVQYLLQIFPDRKPARGVWHEIKVEVQSKEKLHSKEILDFGQGSVGFYRP